MEKCSLIISVYNQVNELELILSALTMQKFKNFEVLIADDGSSSKIKNFIADFTAHSPFKINHIWHNDKGFRKNIILNEAIKKADTQYLIFIDGDCIPHSQFVYQHYHNRNTNTVLCGRRVNLGKKLSNEISAETILKKEFQNVGVKHFYDSIKLDKNIRSSWVEEGLLIKNKIIRNLYIKGEPRIVGCNFSLYKETIEKINGFDENYIGPGFGEDADVEYRLRLAGTKFKTLRNLAILFHLYHPLAKRADKNHEYYKAVLKKNDPVCKNGLVKINNE